MSAEPLRRIKREAPSRTFQIAVGDGYVLAPVACTAGALDARQVACLTAWRNRHVRAFLHEFVATETRTAEWLVNVVGPDDTKIMFMLEDAQARPVGYLGLGFIEWDRRYGEADNIVRGEELPRGTMKRALVTLLDFARRDLGLESLAVRVLEDNPACEFYRRCGFVDRLRQPVDEVIVPDGRKWVPRAGDDGDAARYLIHFTFVPNPEGATR